MNAMTRRRLLVPTLVVVYAAVGAAPPPVPPATPAPASGRERTRALLASVRVPFERAVETATHQTGGTPITALIRRRDDGVVYEFRLIIGNDERSVEVDAVGEKPANVRDALLTERRRRTIAELRPLLEVAEVDFAKAVALALATAPGARFLAAESEVERSALKFAVTMLTEQGISKVEIDAATGAVGTPVSETPKPVDDPNVRHFDHDKPGALPAGWKVGATRGDGVLATWQVVVDETAPSAPNVLALVKTNHDSPDAFNLCWVEQPLIRNGRLEARFKSVAGEEDQGGGIVWHVKDADNYYVCRFNPLEENLRAYVVKDGVRKQLGSTKASAKPGEWHTIGVRFVGDRIECFMNGQVLLQARDATFPGAGGVGFWTKADAVTRFDDFRIEPLADDALPVEALETQPAAK